MADAVVQSVISKAAIAVLEEGSRLFGIQKNIESVQETMNSLLSYLKDIESQKTETPASRKLIIDIRDLAQDAEDILDTYFAKIASGSTKGLLGFLKLNSRILLNCTTVRGINQDSEGIKARAEKLAKSKGELKPESDSGFRAVDAELWRERRKFLLVSREPREIVGRQETYNYIAKMLRDRDARRCKIITIFGQGGVGKTSVAKRVYKDLTDHYCKKATVYVSPDPDADTILRDIAKQVGLGDDKMDEHLVNNLYLYLQKNKYVIFLDDIWNRKTWDQLKDALMIDSRNGSRIIVTTRDSDVGAYIHDSATYQRVDSIRVPLDVLKKEDALKLFQDMISSNYKEDITKPLQDIGEKIVEKCGGLPLAIDVVGGMLRGKQKTVYVWKDVLGKMSQIQEFDCLKILALSYKDLQPESKPLFLYLGIFPENYEINVSQLIPLWIAEKFIPDDGNQEAYVDEQINLFSYRNLVQVTRRKSDGRAEICSLHSLVYELCRQLAEEHNYFCTRNNLKLSSDVAPKKRRRLTTNTGVLRKNAFQNVKIQKLRALFCFCKDEDLFTFMKNEASDLKFLRILIIEFSDRDLVNVPEEISHLSSLICLKLVGNLYEIPEGIRRLRRLQTLETRSKDIPEGILKMKHIKHLFVSCSIVVKKSHNLCCSKSRDVDKGVKLDLPSVESLDIDFGPNFSLAPSSVKKLTSLKRLGIYVTKREMLEKVFQAAPVLPNLEALKLKIYVSFFHKHKEDDRNPKPSNGDDRIPKLHLSCHENLKKLILYFDEPCDITGKDVFPCNAVSITLIRVTKIHEHINDLRKLLHLEHLELKMCTADKLEFPAGGGSFSHLQSLALKQTKFKKLKIDEGLKLDWIKYEPSPLSRNATVKIPEALWKRNAMDDTYEDEVGNTEW